MTRFTSLAAIAFFVTSCAGRPPTVLLVAREPSLDMALMIQKEVTPIIQKLTEAGYTVTVASERGAELVAGDQRLTVDKKLSDVDVRDYVGVIVPCMAAVDTVRHFPAEVQLVAAANKAGLPLAAQTGGVLILDAAGALAGKGFAMVEQEKDSVTGGTWKGTGVVRDGLVVTSGICPYMARELGVTDGTEELVTTFIAMLKEQSRA